MRVKIKGEITAERLAEALAAAARNYEAAKPGHKIFGANLYLNAYDEDGFPFELKDHRGAPLIITIEAESGGLLRPAVSDEGRQRKKLEDDAAAAKLQETSRRLEEWHKKEREAREQQEQEIAALEAPLRQEVDSLNEDTGTLMQSMPDRFITELNGLLTSIWDELKPVIQVGSDAGAPMPLPTYYREGEKLYLAVESWSKPRKLSNPICSFESRYSLSPGIIKPIWRHYAWHLAMERVPKLIKTLLAESINPTT